MKGESFIIPDASLSAARAEAEKDDAIVSIPNVLLPIVELSRAFRSGSSDQPFTNTFSISGNIRVANAAAFTADLAQIGKGVWRLIMMFAYHANYTSTGNTFTDSGWGLNQNALRTDQPLWYANQNLSQNKQITMVVNLPSTTILQYFLSANTVGQEHRLAASVIGQLLF